ncbi:MAG: major capsid protein [Melioribacteraceae bacterium]|nr:major capsid protein [Melioribacteraceae bacterium]MCF8414556.1 major capsid protein [Melioribacteraceae bacterium]
MAITINVFSQAFIDGVLEILKPPTTFLRDKFFVGDPELHEVDNIIVDIEVEGQKIAAIVSATDNPTRVARDSYSSNQVKTPKVLMFSELNPRDFMDTRQSGEAGITNVSDPKFKAKAQKELAKLLKKLQDMETRLEEWMAAQALLGGGWTATLPNGKKYTIDFQRPNTHTVTLTGDDKWDAPTTANPLNVIETKAQLISRAVSAQPTIVVMNRTTKQKLLAIESFTSALDNRRMNRGTVDTSKKELESGAKKFAEIDSFEFYEYDAQYTDYDGNSQLYVPDSKVIIGVEKFAGNVIHYGPIEDFEAMPDVRRKYFSKNWTEKMPSKWLLSFESHPLLAMHKPEAAVALDVY